jgi:hypothetical protein
MLCTGLFPPSRFSPVRRATTRPAWWNRVLKAAPLDGSILPETMFWGRKTHSTSIFSEPLISEAKDMSFFWFFLGLGLTILVLRSLQNSAEDV